MLWIALWIVVYLLIGGIVYAAVCNNEDDYDEPIGLLFAWPIFIFMLICMFIVDSLKAFGYSVVNFFNRYIYQGEENNEKQE